MTQRAAHVKPDKDADRPPPPAFDRKLNPFEEAAIRRLWARGHGAYRIANLLRLRYARVQALCDRLAATNRG